MLDVGVKFYTKNVQFVFHAPVVKSHLRSENEARFSAPNVALRAIGGRYCETGCEAKNTPLFGATENARPDIARQSKLWRTDIARVDIARLVSVFE